MSSVAAASPLTEATPAGAAVSAVAGRSPAARVLADRRRARRRLAWLLPAAVVIVALAVTIPLLLVNRVLVGNRGAADMRYVVLTPQRELTAQGLGGTIDLLEDRAAGLGIDDVEVRAAADGKSLLLGLPAADVGLIATLTAPGRLEFREVYTSGLAEPGPQPTAAPAVPSPAAVPIPTPIATLAPTATPTRAAMAWPTPTPTASTSLSADATPPADVMYAFGALSCDAAPNVGPAEAQDWTVACDKDGAVTYLLKPAAVVGADVKSASAGQPQTSAGGANINTGQWVVNVEFTGSGQKKFTQLTEDTIGKQTAIVLDGVVQSAPTTNDRIPGSAQISGSFTESEARDLAAVLNAGALAVDLVAGPPATTAPSGFGT
ncbi:hypothetical protein I6A84_36455 [Frankia sp. CNm7]|uniref:SecDF P1 head subdomain domain-containing protein n=1 Tax=Frankia nepalensis TaxID=1836974 RepID=A0A937RKP8_9ACTN|nr:hypothetical protein [Frankia nepalensis]MBL7496081.1 hypothetical protein [Frankia nepalensis]MBL7511130.1 hypothetical protein [Frankia nepalensis]MBL7523404.1 hypothetical protein [Frankia nepalensis]MBL7630685.1 hypothetical protein [Frankia nepalensis]